MVFRKRQDAPLALPPALYTPLGWGDTSTGGLCSEKRGEGGLGIPMWVLGVGEQQGGGGRESHK